MSRTIIDYEKNGKIHDIIKKANSFCVYEYVQDLKWHPVSEMPLEGQFVIACISNDFRAWNDTGYYADGMLFDKDWDWAREFKDYDGWMPMPLPINFKGGE